MCELFTFDTVFLCGEGEGNKRGRGKQAGVAGVNVGIVAIADLELDVLQSEGMFGIPGGVGVFSWTKKKIKCHPDAINGGLVSSGIGGKSGSLHQDRHRDRLNTSWGRILLLPRRIHAGKTEVLFAGLIQPGIYGPQAGKFLADKPNRVLNRASSVGVIGDSAVTPTDPKGLKKWDRVGHF